LSYFYCNILFKLTFLNFKDIYYTLLFISYTRDIQELFMIYMRTLFKSYFDFIANSYVI